MTQSVKPALQLSALPEVMALQAYAADAPSSNPGEGYWDSMEEAYHSGHREEQFEAARLIRRVLETLGVDAPIGREICGGCSQYVDEDRHDPDCTAVSA